MSHGPVEERARRMGAAGRETAVDEIREVRAARDELREALATVGVRLPSLGLDLVSLASPHLAPLVDLGHCRPDVARRLASVIRQAGTP
ncbi:hypothetical protein [Streptomyces sp. NPDC048577]|uniref:hypothetical protein n=1 Tax=Streptomyces sp. NPDC048577 TaxID=3157209 RepID=UPI0034377B60